MRIAYDTQSIFSGISRHRGIGNYTLSHLAGIIEASPEDAHVLFNIYSASSAIEELWPNGDAPAQVSEVMLYIGESDYLIRRLDEDGVQVFEPMLKAIVRRFLTENEIELFYFTSPFERENIFHLDWYEGVRTAATVYDVIPYFFPWDHFGRRTEKDIYMDRIAFLRQMDQLLVISGSVRDDLLKIGGFDAEKIAVIYAGIDSAYQKTAVDNEAKLRQKYGINGKFILCSGGATPRKNMEELTDAFSNLPRDVIEKYLLVFVCKMDENWMGLIKKAARNGKVENRVICTSFVPLEDLCALYNMADLMAFPSQYEGFGLPVIEAMACGCPVLTSDNSSLGEIAQGAAVLVNPFSIEDITRGLLEALSVDMRQKYGDEMAKKVQMYTWANTVLLTKKAFAEIQSPRCKKEKPDAMQARIAVFTPLPPLESGISDYCEDVLNAMAPLCKGIDVFVDNGVEVNCPLADNIRIFPHTEYPARHSDYAQTLYHVGNSMFHAYMIPYVQKYRGVVMLHDINLNGLLYHVSINIERDERLYKKFYIEDFPEKSGEFVENQNMGFYWDHYGDIELNGAVCNYADKIITHSEYGRTELLCADPTRDVSVIRHYANKLEPRERDEMRRKYNIPVDAFVFAAFGFISESKGIEKALKAFAQVRKKHVNAFFLLAGKTDDVMRKIIRELAVKYHFADSVRVTGFTQIEEFKDYIFLCDVCVNLRYPYRGETSGSLMRILAAGKPVIVNDIGSFAEVPDECATKIEVRTGEENIFEISAIKDAFLHYLEDRDFVIEQGKAAMKYAEEELDLEKIARQYVECILTPAQRGTLGKEVFKAQFNLLLEEVVVNAFAPKAEAEKWVSTVAYAARG